MKKALSLILCLLLTLASASFAFAADDLSIDKTWSVLVPASPTEYERFAAQKLCEGLSEALGAEIKTVTSPAGHYIALGGASEADVSGVADNGYRITAKNGSLHIGGTGVRGLQAGVYRFLEEFCGRKVYTASLIVLPETDAIAVPADTDLVYEPFFEYTDTDWRSPCDTEYSMANGLNGGTYRRIPAEMGGTVNYIEGFCHTMGGLCETEKYAESHPEYLALHDGKRTTDQPCLTNPEVLAIATRNVLDKVARNHDPNASVQIVSVTQNDNYNYCECETCRAFEAAHGGVQSATMIWFVNQIADAVKAAGYDNVAVDTFAYQYTRQAPTGIVPRDNVIVRLCTIECCFHHTLDDPACANNVALMKDLSDWGKICDRIYVWDYTTNYLNTCNVFPDFNVIQRNIQVFSENHVKGVYEEGNYYIANCDAEFGELRAYMISKALQDPYCDMDKEVNGFLEAYYGPGWRNIRKALDLFVAFGGNEDGHLTIGSGTGDSLRLSDYQVRDVDSWFRAAKNSAATAEQLEHIRRSELSWRFWKSSERRGEFSIANPARFDLNEQLFNDLQRYGVKQLNEGGYGDYLDCICIRWVPAAEWNMYEDDEPPAHVRAFFSKLLEKCTPMLSALGFYHFMWNEFLAFTAPLAAKTTLC